MINAVHRYMSIKNIAADPVALFGGKRRKTFCWNERYAKLYRRLSNKQIHVTCIVQRYIPLNPNILENNNCTDRLKRKNLSHWDNYLKKKSIIHGERRSYYTILVEIFTAMSNIRLNHLLCDISTTNTQFANWLNINSVILRIYRDFKISLPSRAPLGMFF